MVCHNPGSMVAPIPFPVIHCPNPIFGLDISVLSIRLAPKKGVTVVFLDKYMNILSNLAKFDTLDETELY